MSKIRRHSRHTSPESPAELEPRLREVIASAPRESPLPTTRVLGERFGVSNTTVFRALQRLTAGGVVWQHANGRYYPAAARALIDRPKPVACLMRRLELRSELYRELLEGVSAGCGARRRTMLLWHDELLVNHTDVTAPPTFASAAQQRGILTDFLKRHGETAGGFVLDHVWCDEVLQEQAEQISHGVVLLRSCPVTYLGNVRADFRAGALMALTHLLAQGFEQIVPVEPFAHDPAIAEFLTALGAAVDELHCRDRVASPGKAGTVRQRQQLVERLRTAGHRIALLIPEDNIAAAVLESARDIGLHCPQDFGLLSAMGTDFGLKAGISCLRYDYRALGRLAVEALEQSNPVRHACVPQFCPGITT